MSQSSERGAYVRFSQARFGGDEPFSSYARELVGNIDHLADQFSQVRVNWVARDASHYFEPEIGAGSILVDTLYRVWQSLPFDLHVRDTGESYSLRCRVRGAISTGTGTAAFRIVIASESHGAAYVSNADLGNTNVAQGASTSSTTHAWMNLVPVPRLSADQVRQAARVPPAIDELGGQVVTGQWLRCTAEVWARTTDVTSVPRLSGVQIAEYYAP